MSNRNRFITAVCGLLLALLAAGVALHWWTTPGGSKRQVFSLERPLRTSSSTLSLRGLGASRGQTLKARLRQLCLTNDVVPLWSMRAEGFDQELLRQELALLSTKDSVLWKPYASLRAKLPAKLAQRLPAWDEPKRIRLGALGLIQRRPSPASERLTMALRRAAKSDPATQVREQAIRTLGSLRDYPVETKPPWLDSLFAELCDMAKTAAPPMRRAAISALSHIGVDYSGQVLPIMLNTLQSDTAWQTKQDAAMWLGRTTPDPQRVVPVLLQGLMDVAVKSDCSDALRAYGARAKFVVEPLVALTKTNDRAISSVATWALRGIDPETAARTGTTFPSR